MKLCYKTTALLLLSFAMLWPTTTQAQSVRGEQTIYFRPHIGQSYYFGDSEKSPVNFNGENFNELPWNVGAEIGWKFNPSTSLGLAVRYGNYSNITAFHSDNDGGVATNVEDHDNTRWGLSLLARKLLSDSKVAPYIFGGATLGGGETTNYSVACANNVVGACTSQSDYAYGVTFGLGLDFFISERASFFIQTGVDALTPDDVSDGRDNNGFSSFDFLGANSLGLHINLKGFVPVEVTDLVCPVNAFDAGTPTTFTGSTNMNATQPVEYMWHFGDGSSAEGQTVTHTFNRAGTYTVGLTATNGAGRGRSVKECTVRVLDPCVAAQITAMRASNMSPDTQTAVNFTASVSGSDVSEYRWNFGDGNTGTGAMASHTYDRAGTYTVTLEATNCNGTVSRTMTITVLPYEAAICREITEMNSAFFAQNSSVLTEEARAALRENLQILLECPNLNVRLEGWAGPGERRPSELAADRARAVEKFYVDNGVAASRIVTQAMGLAEGTSKKDGASQYRRVDTIPVR